MYTIPILRRFLSLVLLLAFGLPTAAPAFGLTADAESTLPPCCRRAGMHHCIRSLADQTAAERDALTHGTRASILTARCPSCPAPPTQLQHRDLAFTTTSTRLTSFTSQAQRIAQIAAWARAAEAGARHKRGPPSIRLS